MFEKDKKLSALSEICLYYLISTEFKYKENLLEKAWSENNKPYLKNIPNLKYSISHSGSKCIAIISDEHKMGIDIEPFLEYNNNEAIKDITKLFSKRELSLAELGTTDLQRAMVIWTKKEAYFKSHGNGALMQILKKEFSCEQMKCIKSILIDDYVISIAPNIDNIRIINAEDIGIKNILNRINDWKDI